MSVHLTLDVCKHENACIQTSKANKSIATSYSLLLFSCANCFAELQEGAKFCLQCGKPAIVATTYYSYPQRDRSIYEELLTTSSQQVKHREYRARYEAWKAAGEYGYFDHKRDDIEGFEQNKAKISLRAKKWVEYEASRWERIHWFQEIVFPHARSEVFSDWTSEKHWFPTNKPHHHKALFYETFFDTYLYKLRQHLVLTYDDSPKPTPLFFEYLRKVREYDESDIEEFELDPPNMKEIQSWPQKDDELFPPPQPIRVEFAGAVLNFTTDEGALVVYMDCDYSSKTVEIHNFQESANLGVCQVFCINTQSIASNNYS